MSEKKDLSLGELKYNLMKIKDYYKTDLGKENVKLNNFIKDLEKKENKKIKIKLNEVEVKVKEFWKELILSYVSELLKKIDTRKTKGSEFSKIKEDLNKTKEELPYDTLDIETLRSYYEENLSSYKEQIREKIDIEKYNKKRFWLGLGIGFLLGVGASLLAWYLSTLLIKK